MTNADQSALLNPTLWRNKDAYQKWYTDAVRKARGIADANRGRTSLSFEDWLYQASPRWPWHYKHLRVVRDSLERVQRGEVKRLMIFLHPRSYKSQMVTIRWAAYMLERDPSLPLIVGCYDGALAAKFSRAIRKLARDRALLLDEERQAVDEWYTAAGGGLRAVGVSGGATGHGAGGILIDDPVKSYAEAHSRAYRERVWEWFKTDLLSRTEPNPQTGQAPFIILTMTRWHEDDLAGRILKSPAGRRWEVLRIPALAETQGERDDYNRKYGLPLGLPDPLNRLPGQAMNPERFNEQALADKLQEQGLLSFAALYQGRPGTAEGDMFKREWFRIVPELPAVGDSGRLVRYWDKAGTEGDTGSATAGVLIAAIDGKYYVVDVVLGRWRAADREAVIDQVAAVDFGRYGDKVETGVEQEPGSGGKESAENTVNRLTAMGYRAFADRPTGDKTLRAEPFAGQAGLFNVFLVNGEWNGDYLDVLSAFPNGAMRDPVDGSSGAFNRLVTYRRQQHKSAAARVVNRDRVREIFD